MAEIVLKDSNVVSDGKREIDRYLAAERAVMSAKRALNSAECEMTNATNALGKWLTPVNAEDGEKFCVWHAGHLIEAVRLDANTFVVRVRQRARP